MAHREYSVSLADGGDNTADSGNTGPVRLQIIFGGRNVGRSGFKPRSFDLSSIGRSCLAEDVVSFFCSCNMIPAALFTAFGPVTFVKILFSLSHSLWKTKLPFPITINGVKYVSSSSITLAIAVSSSKPKEYDSQWQSLFKILVSCILL